jgi:cytochrome oxidase Cu insertion factor (SCO1/SenC/PrrC family)
MMRLLPLLILLAMGANLPGSVVDLAPQRGRAVAAINWTDETGRVRQLSELAGYPVILLPIYTRCRSACVGNVDRLKEALADSANDISQSRVLLFSFDPTDDPVTLMKYRRRENVPLGWLTGAGSQKDIDTLLESIGVQVGKAGIEFTHPNVVLFLDSKLRIAKWIYGTDYSKTDVDLALRVATGRNDWIGQHSDFLYTGLLFAASVLCVILVHSIRQLVQVRWLGRSRPPRPPSVIRA